MKGTGRVVVFGENVEPLKGIARGLQAGREGWEMGEKILYIDGNVGLAERQEM